MNPAAVAKQKQDQIIFVKNRLVADSSTKELPTRIQIIKAGTWENSWKGDIEITVTDLLEMALNFKKGIGLPDGGSEGAPVDYSHEDWSKAAFWIKSLEVDEVNGILWASEIEWTPAGQEAVQGGEYKFFSPSVYPRSLGKWQDPEDPSNTAQNVLLGGGLTNIPFFKGLTGLKASRTPQGDGVENVIYFAKEGETMELANLRTKKKEELSTEETAFLAEHKTELTAEEQINLGLTEAPAPVTPTQVVEQATEEPAPVVDAELAALTADIKSGKKVLVEKAEYDGLKASAQKSESKLAEMEKKEIEGRVDAHIARGAIKADMKEKYVGLIQADASNEELLTSLPDNPLLASEVGAAGDAGVTALEQLRGKANEILKASTEAGAQSDIGKAMSQARKENPDLAKEADAEMQGKKN